MSVVPALSTATVLDVRLCGPTTFTWQGQAVSVPPRLGALIVYLLLNGPTPREDLREVFWPDGGPQHLRQALYLLRALPGAETWLMDTEGRLSVKATTDLPALEDLLDQREVPLAALRRWPGGELLAGLRVEHSGPLEGWLTSQRAHWSMRQAGAFERWGELALGVGQADVALDAARTWITLTPLDERATRLLMRAHAAAGNLAGVQAAWTALRLGMKQTLDAEPDDETRALHRELMGQGGARHGRATLFSKGQTGPEADEPLQGRAAELRKLADLLDTTVRVGLHGLAGIGKTRLAAAAAQELLERRGGQVLWLTVGDDPPAAALNALHDALGVRSGHPLEPALTERAVRLVVLDDLWDPDTLPALLATLPTTLPVLVTSRSRWDGLKAITVERLAREDALALLCAHAPSLHFDDLEADALCALLGHHPYALRLAGRTLHGQGLSPGDLLRDLQGVPHTLGGGRVDALLRQSTRALGAAEYEAFLGLGSLPVSTTTPEFLGLALRRDPAEVEEALYGLVRRGLAIREAQAGSETVRYGMHDLTWSAARAREALLPTTVTAAALAYARAYTGDPARLDAERATLLEVLHRAQHENAPLLVDLLDAWLGGTYLAARGFPTAHLEVLRVGAAQAAQARRWREAAVLHGKLADVQHGLLGDGATAALTYGEAARYAAQAGLSERQATFLGLSATLRAINRLSGVEECLARALDCARDSGDLVCLARILEQRGLTRAMAGDFLEARQGFLEARTALTPRPGAGHARQSPAEGAYLSATGNLAQAEQRLGNLDMAAGYREEVLALALARDEHLRVAHARADLGELYAVLGRVDEARDQLIQATDLYRTLGAVGPEAAARTLLTALPRGQSRRS